MTATPHRIGVLLPTREQAITGSTGMPAILDFARQAEELGFDALWTGDSLVARSRLDPFVVVRSRSSASKIGASEKRNRSSAPESESVFPASDRAENGCQDGTTKRSPRVTVHVWSPTVTEPEPSKTW